MIRIKELINTMSDRERLDAVILIEHGKGQRFYTNTIPDMIEEYGNRGLKSWITDKYHNEHGEIRLSIFIELREVSK